MENTDFEIELQDIKIEQTIEEIELPKNFQIVGEIQKNDVRVYMKQDVYHALEKFAASDTTKELGSFLIGDYIGEKNGNYHVVISDYVEAKYTDATTSTLTYTHETWNDYYEEKERLYPEKKLVGWQHTHPNYGIFLSSYDLFIQENTFNLPFQVAYVIDPIQGRRGFFTWKDGRVNPLEPLKGYYIYDEEGKTIKMKETKVKRPVGKETKMSSVGLKLWIAVLSMLVLVLGVFTINLNKRYEEQLNVQQNLIEELEEQKLLSGIQQSSIADLESKLSEKEEVPKEEPKQETGVVSFKTYTVVAGDSLIKICEQNGIDYEKNKNIILSVNGITNPSAIKVGQTILLPIIE